MTARSRIWSCGNAVSQGDIIFVPAGTIHAIGAGLVIAEIQQRSDATFRMFDYGRGRELHIDNAIAVARCGTGRLSRCRRNGLTDERALLVSNPHFVFERINLAPNSAWCLEAERETWLLVLSGSARAGSFDVGNRRCHFRAVGSRRHSCRRRWHGVPRRIHRRRPDFSSAGGGPRAGRIGSRTTRKGSGANALAASKGGPGQPAPGNNSMKSIQRVAFIGNHLPRRCGIATFTHDLHRAVADSSPGS